MATKIHPQNGSSVSTIDCPYLIEAPFKAFENRVDPDQIAFVFEI